MKGKRALSTLRVGGLMSTTAGLDMMTKRNSSLCWEENPNHPAHSSHSLYGLSCWLSLAYEHHTNERRIQFEKIF
jgi:hypothetical protein